MKKLLSVIAIMAICGYSFSQIDVLTNGNVGVGITNPTQKLHVVGTSLLNGNVGVGITPSELFHVNGGALKIGNGYDAISRAENMIKIGDQSYIQIGEWEADDMLSFKANKYNFTNGNVGINVANPTHKLQVDGSVFIGNNYPHYIGQAGLTIHTVLEPTGGAWSYDVGYCDVYGLLDNRVRLGKTDNRLNNIWTYTLNYVTLTGPSDARLKENIRPCPAFLSKLKEIKSYNYNYTDEFFKNFTPWQKERAQRTEFGFLAQELQKVFPELVHEDDSTGMLSINYVSMIPILTSAINELQQEKESQQNIVEELQKEFQQEKEFQQNMIETLLQRVESLEKALARCCQTNQPKSAKTEEGNTIQEFDLTDPTGGNAEEMKVYQNVPNPFNERTTIQGYIPQTVKKAELCVYNMQGVQVKCFPVMERGTFTVQIQAGQLSAGVYNYFLIGDRKTTDAKQMILTK